jgi:hypothetical protein
LKKVLKQYILIKNFPNIKIYLLRIEKTIIIILLSYLLKINFFVFENEALNDLINSHMVKIELFTLDYKDKLSETKLKH